MEGNGLHPTLPFCCGALFVEVEVERGTSYYRKGGGGLSQGLPRSLTLPPALEGIKGDQL